MTDVSRLGLGPAKSRQINGFSINYLAHGGGWRYDTLLEKEPETIEWINGFKPGDTMWDIGANVGIYSIYAAMRGINVMAFEPHFGNYFQLCVNIMLNNLQDRVMPMCMAFTRRKEVNTINLASIDFGSSMSSFGSNLDFRGNAYKPEFSQGMLGIDIDSFVEEFQISYPNHIKIDVDGIELDIVAGGRRTLGNRAVRSVSIELIDSDQRQVDGVSAVMSDAGLNFIHKKQNAEFATPQTRDVLNYLYCR
ncbi:MAG: FkbM family methyltransferase [Gammaproteobacteria bacterium]